jgi:DHA1 family tetracycline resistance protein-like MFS transporter
MTLYIYLDSTQIDRNRQNKSVLQNLKYGFLRPFQELSILNRNRLFQLLSALAFFSGMSASADQTLLIYYSEDHLSFNDHDVAVLFMLMGVLGIIVQGFCLKALTDYLGERMVVVISFLSGAIKNTMYGLGSSKGCIIAAAAIGSLANMSFPTISAMKANNVSSSEQGRIQGALYALSSLASAIGPVILKYVSTHYSENTTHPGSYFLVATIFMLIATGCAYVLPKDKANSTQSTNNDSETMRV